MYDENTEEPRDLIDTLEKGSVEYKETMDAVVDCIREEVNGSTIFSVVNPGAEHEISTIYKYIEHGLEHSRFNHTRLSIFRYPVTPAVTVIKIHFDPPFIVTPKEIMEFINMSKSAGIEITTSIDEDNDGMYVEIGFPNEMQVFTTQKNE